MSKTPSEDNNIKIPLIWRLRAWWYGYDLEDVRARLSESADTPAINNPEDDSEDLILDDIDTSEMDDNFKSLEETHVAVKAVWNEDRAQVAQVFWGDGFCGPGGPENIISMTTPLNINSKRTAMVIGAGLGGPVRAMQKEYDTPIDGYESSKELATTGMRMSQEAGIAQDAPITHINLENTTQFPRSYDRAYAKETMFIIANKSQLIQSIFDHLKKEGLFLLTEYVLPTNADQNSAIFREWCELEPYKPQPVTSADMEGYIEDAGFTLKLNEDITNDYLDLISNARRHAKKVITTMEADDVKDVTILKYMLNEAVFWNTRAKLLRSGDLKVIKYLCHKSG